jgi:phosphonatase-like hydrolase
MHIIKLAVFDMAGTVVNENNIVYRTLQKAINERGFQVDLNFVLEHGAGKEKHQAIKDIIEAEMGNVDSEMAASIFEDFKKLLGNAYKNLKVESYEGVEKMLHAIKESGIKVALNTGYDTNTAQLLLDKMKWTIGKEYDILITADDVVLGRPNPDMIVEAMMKLNVLDEEFVLKAGDSIIDIKEGKNANCGVTIGVTTGAHTRKQLLSANPTYVLDSLSELTNLIKFK